MFYQNKPDARMLQPFTAPQHGWQKRSGGCNTCRPAEPADPYIGLGKQPASQPIMYGPFQQYPYRNHYFGDQQQ
ncbi:MAG: hypothetical protein ACI35O_05645 [Bacillaceae bacterium]